MSCWAIFRGSGVRVKRIWYDMERVSWDFGARGWERVMRKNWVELGNKLASRRPNRRMEVEMLTCKDHIRQPQS